MRVFHLFSNHKFTGPADPALDLARAIGACGHEVAVAVGRGPRGDGRAKDETGLLAVATQRGLRTMESVVLPKHGHPVATLRAVRSLRACMRAAPPAVVHSHLPGDHFVAALAAASLGVPIVRTYYDAMPEFGVRARFALAKTAGALVFSAAVAARIARHVPALAARNCINVIEPAVDLARFAYPRDAGIRSQWQAGESNIVCGVVARMQRHRMFPELISGFAAAAASDPRLHLVILGRGTHSEEVAIRPAQRSGVSERIHFPGYIAPEEYPRILPCFDLLIFLVPGSDGTCRAAREALASGVPVIASRRGLLPEFIQDGVNGILLPDETPSAIASAIRALAGDRARRASLAKGAADYARAHFDIARQVEAVLALYRRVAEGRN